MRVRAAGVASRTRDQSRSRGPGTPSPSSQRSRASLRGVSGAVMKRWARLRTASSSASVRRRRLRALPAIGAMLAGAGAAPARALSGFGDGRGSRLRDAGEARVAGRVHAEEAGDAADLEEPGDVARLGGDHELAAP